MKSICFVFMLTLFVTNAFAACLDKKEPVREAFARDFSNASEVSYEVSPSYVKVNFTVSGQVLYAYYTNSGDLLAIVRNITSDKLPLLLLLQLKTAFKNYWVTELFEVVNGEEHRYFVTLENSDREMVLRSARDKEWNLVSRTNK